MDKVVFASIDEIRSILLNGYTSFVWPDEGQFKGKRFIFNDEHKKFEPLMCDSFTASLLVQVFDKLKPELQTRIAEHIQKGRGHFAQFLEKCWQVAK